MIRGVYTAAKSGHSHRMTYRISYTEFTAADAARITGISQEEQRDWRKRGFLPPIEGGKARFDVKLLSGMLVAKRLHTLGIAPSTGWALARSCGVIIYARLMNSRRGVLDEHNLAHGDLVQIAPGSDARARWAVTDDGTMWGLASTPDELASHVGAATIVLDLEQLADHLVQRAQRVLATVKADQA